MYQTRPPTLQKEGVFLLSPFKSSTGISENLAGFLCYLFAFVGGVIFLAVERRSRFVLFHALQSVMLFGGLMLGHMVSGLLPLIGVIVSTLLSLIGIACWLILMITALQGRWFKIPMVGDIAEQQMHRFF